MQDAEGYFKFGNHCDSIVGVIIVSIIKALYLNLSIYQKLLDRNIQVIEQATDMRGRAVHLKLMQDPQNASHNHYDAILLFDKPGQILDQDKPSPTRQQIMMQQDDYEIADMTADSDTTLMQ